MCSNGEAGALGELVHKKICATDHMQSNFTGWKH